jgi:zinc protease
MRRMGWRMPLAGLVLLVPACATAPAGPAVAPAYPTTFPDPLPVEDVAFPEYHERTLSNGARLLVVERHDQPVVSVQLILAGGSSSDPDGRTGLASVTAALLDKGTPTRSATEIAEEIDFLGASLGASAGLDWSSVSLTTLRDFLDRGLGLMSDVVLRPTFPADELVTEQRRRVSSLQLQRSQPQSLAQRTFTARLFGDHPYGALETVESVQALSRADLDRFHQARYRPEGAMFVVAGAVSPDAAAAALEHAFAGWSGRAPARGADPAPPARVDRRMVFVHVPGSVQAVIRLGHVMPSAAEAEWVTLDVANQVLGSPSAQFASWTMRILREERGYTYGAYSTMAQRVGPGVFALSGEFRNEVADSALHIMIELAERLRAGDIPAQDLETAHLFLTGSFPLSIETPQQVAQQVASNRLLGRPDSYLEQYRSRVAEVGVQDIARAAGAHIQPDRSLVVVVGDATQVLERVRPFAAAVEVVDPDGRPLDPAALTATAPASGAR